jgi:uracil-DNA glycosylase family protein
MLVGEQPGDEEDRAGVPFVGPSGRLLDALLERAGIDRRLAYVTNAVKHFKWEAQGARRLHKKPSAREARACLPWLSAEIEVVNPEVIVCLGATAAQSLLGASARVSQMRGKFVSGPSSASILVTAHPAAILRLRDADERKAEEERFVADLRQVSRRLKASASG